VDVVHVVVVVFLTEEEEADKFPPEFCGDSPR